MVTGGDSVRVLHVDDDPAFTDLSAAALEDGNERFTVETAARASEGMSRLDESSVDCIVSDYEMPGQNGIEFLSTVREEYPDLPFILFTGKGSETIASDAISAGTTDYLQKGSGTDQFVLLANRITNAVQSDRARQQATRHKRITALIRNINQQLVAADTVGAVERAVCETIAQSEPYLFAWVGEPDEGTGEVVPRTSAGGAESYLEEVTIRYDRGSHAQGPGGRAVTTEEEQVVQDIPSDPSFEPWRDTAKAYGYKSVLVLPLHTHGTLHGILAIYADRRDAFGETEQEVLAELTESISEAIVAATTRHELAETNTAFRTVLESLTAGVLVEDSDRRVLVANERLCTLFDLSAPASDLVGRDRRRVAEDIVERFERPDECLDGVHEAVERRDPLWNEELALADGRTLELDYVPYALQTARRISGSAATSPTAPNTSDGWRHSSSGHSS
jgi:CheY-like chemotaxis protein